MGSARYDAIMCITPEGKIHYKPKNEAKLTLGSLYDASENSHQERQDLPPVGHKGPGILRQGLKSESHTTGQSSPCKRVQVKA